VNSGSPDDKQINNAATLPELFNFLSRQERKEKPGIIYIILAPLR
jgi:hypothetical protein